MATLALVLQGDVSPPEPPPHVVTTVTGKNADLIAEVTKLYALDGKRVADVTYGRGDFWSKVDTSRFTLLGTDLSIDPTLVAQGSLWAAQAPACLVADFTALPYAAACLDAVAFDPPYQSYPGPQLKLNRTYRNYQTSQGMSHADILRDFYCLGILEAARVLKPGGWLWVKGKDETVSGVPCWSQAEVRQAAERCGFAAIDQFFLLRQGSNAALFARHQTQQHAHKNSSWLWIFKRETTGPLAKRGRPKKGRSIYRSL